MDMKHPQFTVELPQDLVDGIKQVSEEMTRQSGKGYTIEETIAVLVVRGFRTVTKDVDFIN